jgi:hypothetical protein
VTKPRMILSLHDSDSAERFVPLVILLSALADTNEYHLRYGLAAGKPYPRLYDSGVRYREEKPGAEDWPDIPAVLAQGWGDCEDLAAYRAAELRVYDGIDAEPVIKWRWIPTEEMIAAGYKRKNLPRSGIWLVHCLVRYPNGEIEDPSKLLGMGGEYMENV